MEWKKFDFGLSKTFKECVLEFAETEKYKFQAEVLKKESLYPVKMFGDFDVSVVVFDQKTRNQIDIKEYNGINGTYKGALKILQECKSEMLKKYA